MFTLLQPTTRYESAKRLLSFLLSLAIHAAVVIALVMIPLVFFSMLPELDLLTFLIEAPEPPAPVPPPPLLPPEGLKVTTVRGIHVEDISYSYPTSIPPRIPDPADDVPPIVDSSLSLIAAQAAVKPGLPGVQPGIPELLKAAPPTAPALPPPPKRSSPLPVGGKVQEAKLLIKVAPVYPELAKRARVSGIVNLQISVDEDGNVYAVNILSGHPLLQQAAVTAVRQWKYSPTLLNGEPVPVTAAVTVIFNLR